MNPLRLYVMRCAVVPSLAHPLLHQSDPYYMYYMGAQRTQVSLTSAGRLSLVPICSHQVQDALVPNARDGVRVGRVEGEEERQGNWGNTAIGHSLLQ